MIYNKHFTHLSLHSWHIFNPQTYPHFSEQPANGNISDTFSLQTLLYLYLYLYFYFSAACKWQYLRYAFSLQILLYFATSLRFSSAGHCRCLSPLGGLPRTGSYSDVTRRRQTWPNAAISPSLLAAITFLWTC